MVIFKIILSVLFFALWVLNLIDLIRKNNFAYKIKLTFFFFLNLVYFFFLLIYFLGKGKFSLNYYSEIYFLLGLLLMIFFFSQELFFYKKSLSVFFLPLVGYIILLGFYFLDQEIKILTFNLFSYESFNYFIEISFLMGNVLFFYGLFLSILYRQMFLEHELKKNNFLTIRLVSLYQLNKLINLNLMVGCSCLLFKIIFLISFFLKREETQVSSYFLFNGIGGLFLFCFFSMVLFFRLKNWLSSKANLKWMYGSISFTLLYFLILY